MIPKILAAPSDELTELLREIVSSLYAFMLQIDERIKAFDRKITAIFKASEVCQRIAKIRGIGPKTATAMIAAIGDGAPTSRTADTWQPGWAWYRASIRAEIAG